jgi:hypothetical protein
MAPVNHTLFDMRTSGLVDKLDEPKGLEQRKKMEDLFQLWRYYHWIRTGLFTAAFVMATAGAIA